MRQKAAPYLARIDHFLTTDSDFYCRWSVFIVGTLFYIVCDRCAVAVQNQQKIAVYHHITRRVVVLRPGRPEVRILPVAPEACDKKDVAGFFFAVSSKIGSFTTQFWDAVLQCCPTILGRFPQLDAHFPCRFLEFGRRRGNFFEKNRINPAVFRMFQFPRSQFPIGCGVFPFFAVAGKMGTARTFIPFPIMRMCGGFSNRISSMRRLQISDTRVAMSYNTHNP